MSGDLSIWEAFFGIGARDSVTISRADRDEIVDLLIVSGMRHGVAPPAEKERLIKMIQRLSA